MDQPTAQFAIKTLLTEILDIWRKPQASPRRPRPAPSRATPIKGVTVARDIEQPVREAGRLLDAASLINRLSKEE